MKIRTVDELKSFRKKISNKKKKDQTIYVCTGTGCRAKGVLDVLEGLKSLVESDSDLKNKVEIKATGCHGFCEQGPLIVFQPDDIFYVGVKTSDVQTIFESTVKKKEIIQKFLYHDLQTMDRVKEHSKIDFYAKQTRVVLKNVGKVDPNSIEDYIREGGFEALELIFSEADAVSSDDVIKIVKDSGIRGRGGAGFPTGKKWESCKKVKSDTRYILCNGDEGDPGAFMDCSIMEGDPFAVLEGMVIGAYAIGAHEGYIYVREEYPLAVINLRIAIEECRKNGLLGKNILGSGFDFDIKISKGAGAFVCGESSALMQSVAGNVGEPRPKYIRSTEKGLYDKPSVLNNVETFANIPQIIVKGAQWFKDLGVKNNSGTKAFSLVGHVRNTGLVEVPMGTTLREMIFGIGGGITDDRPFKAVQTGGPSGGCLPADKLDTPIDFDSLVREGSMMGSGGMIVMHDRSCMVDVARYFLKFLEEESCGKCIPCREGTYQMHQILRRICEGNGRLQDLDTLEQLSRSVQKGSLCALGTSAPNPVLSTIRNFRQEYIEHIRDKKCKAGVCKSLCTFKINDNCSGCTLCAKSCPANCITGVIKKKHEIDQAKCIKCGECRKVCKFEAVDV